MAAYAIQFRRGTTTQHNSFTGLLGEVTVDTDKKTLVVHDGSTTGGFPLAREGAASTASTGTFTSNVTVGGTFNVTSTSTFNDDVAIVGDLGMTGHIIPSANVTYDLGSPTMMWRDVYVGPGSLYINGSKVLEDNSGTIRMSADLGQNIKIESTGTGALQLVGGAGIQVLGEINAVTGDIQLGDHLDMQSNLVKNVSAPVTGTDAANKSYVDSKVLSEITGGTRAISGTTGDFSSNVTIAGNLTVSGTQTVVNTQTLSVADNIVDLNSDFTSGTPSENAGIRVLRGDEVAVQLRWNESADNWEFTNNGVNYFPIATSTDDLAEGSNLYFTDARAQAAVASDIATAKSGAEATASADASTKATAAETNAKAYTDTRETAITTAYQTYADQAEADAKAYTDTRETAITTAYQTYADAAETDAVAAAKTYTDGRESAITSAYTSAIATAVSAKDNSDEITEGTSNLYFTDARARASLSVGGDLSYNSTTGEFSFVERTDTEVRGLFTASGDLSYNNGTGQFSVTTYKSADFDTDFGNKSTNDLGEGATNKYFTDARARAAISVVDNGGDGALSYNSTNGVITYTGPSAAQVRAHISAGTGITVTDGVIATTITQYTDTDARSAISVSGDLSYDSATGVISTQGLASSTTDDLSEGSNLYFTDARADARVAAALAGNVTIGGNLTVSGTTTSVNTETIELADNILLLNSNATGAATASGGIEIERGDDVNVQFVWDEANDRWSTGAEDMYTAGAFIGALTGNADTATQVANLDNHNTDDLSEGTNMYWTDARGNANFATNLESSDTDDLDEGAGNLYFTTARARAAVTAGGDLSYNEANGTFSFTERTDAEVATLAKAAFSASGDLSYADGVFSFTERTDAEVETLAKGAISVSGDLSYANGVISFTETAQDFAFASLTGKPTTVSGYGITDAYTKTEVDSAISTAVAGKDSLAELSGSTDDVSEGTTNLYYTDTRVDDRIANNTGTNLDLSQKNTDHLGEGATNKYFTVERAQDAAASMITAGDNITVTYDDAANTLTISGVEDLFSNNTTTDLDEGDNLYFTDARAVAAVRSAINMTHSGIYVVTAADETGNTGSAHAITAATLGFDLSGAEMYMVYLNRQLLRPTEYSVNSSNGTLTFSSDVIFADDEIEAVIYK